ncbi:hypothetical protein SNE40_018937 [Patella caerulea]|uniref:VWFC domain-containing protein n=2 Tax=Patella caerulea TaxID=87958 RepID=A0AAN8J689_PATCE
MMKYIALLVCCVAITTAQICFYEGKYYHDKEIFYDNDCSQCECLLGNIVCTHLVCINPRCVDYESKNCCWHCPNGNNCPLPESDETIPSDGEFHKTNSTTKCMCPTVDDYSNSNTDPEIQEAVCQNMVGRSKKVEDETCNYNGTVYKNKEVFRTNTCHNCQCIANVIVCKRIECVNPLCVDYTVKDCCWECPNGKNCRAPNGKVIPNDGKFHSINSTTVCECPEIKIELPALSKVYLMDAVCKSKEITSTVPPPPTTELNENDSAKVPTTKVPFYRTTCEPCPDPMKLPAKKLVFKIMSSWIFQLAQSLEKMEDCIF